MSTPRPRSLRGAEIGALLLALAMLAAGCAKKPAPPPPPPPDADASPPQARPLPLATTRPDSLQRNAKDLDDWYRLEIPAEGTLTVTLTAADSVGLPHLFIALADEQGLSTVQPTRAGGRAQVVVTERVRPGVRLVWIGTDPEAGGAIPYELRADFVPRKRAAVPKPAPAPARRVEPRPPPTPPPPPAPEFETFTSSVVEVDRAQGSAQFATIRGGSGAGLRPGLRGRLLDGGRVIGRFTIVEVYGAGSKVRVDGGLSGSVSSRTVVEVDVPR